MNHSSALHNRRRRNTAVAATIFLLPAFAFIIVFIAYPIIESFSLSLTSWNGIDAVKQFVGLDNWKTLATDGVFYKALLNNLVIMVLSILIQLPIAMALALLLDFGGKKLNILKVIYFLPMLMSSVAIGFLFKYVYDPQFGIFSAIAQLFGQSVMVDLLGSPIAALYGVIAVICWQFIPFYMVFFLAGLSSLPEEVFEASIIDGATRGQYFWRVALPMMSGTVKSAVILSLIGSLKYFDLIFVLTGGGPDDATQLMATYMYKNAFQIQKMSYGATIASALFVIITVISLIAIRLMNGKKEADGI